MRFQKSINGQHWFIAMLEKWDLRKDKGNYFGSMLTDLSNAFDCLLQELLIAKFVAFGFNTGKQKKKN